MDIERRLVAAIDRMPAFPRSVERILALTRDIQCEPKAIVEVLETDPVMAARVLRTINSAYYALPRPISSMTHAVVMLGINTVKHMALAISTIGMMPTHNPAGFDTDAYLQHSLLVAALARLIAQRLGDTDPSEAYIAGLLHDFGKVLFAVNLPREFAEVLDLAAGEKLPLYIAEQRVMGVDHTLVGAMLAGKWNLPAELAACIGAHHGSDIRPGMLRCLFIADQLVKLDIPGRQPMPLPANLAPQLGDTWEVIASALPQRQRILDEAKVIFR